MSATPSSDNNNNGPPSEPEPWEIRELPQCEDCGQIYVAAGFHYDNNEGCHEICEPCAAKRGFRANQALV